MTEGKLLSMRTAALICAALLPWRLAYSVIKRFAIRACSDPAVDAACVEARAWGIVSDAEAFAQRFALYRLIDHATLRWLGCAVVDGSANG